MQIMVADTVDDIRMLGDLLQRSAESSRNAEFGMPPADAETTAASLCRMLGRPDSCVFVLFDGAVAVGVLAVSARRGVVQEQCFYMTDFAHTRQLVNAAKAWGKAKGCTAIKINSSSVDEEKRPRILRLLAMRGGFSKYSESYVARIS